MTDCRIRNISTGLLMDEVRQMFEEYRKDFPSFVNDKPNGAFLVMYTDLDEIMCTFRISVRSAQLKARELIRLRDGISDAMYYRWFILGPDKCKEYEFDRG